MRYSVQIAHEKSGHTETLVIEAKDVADARRVVNKAGFLVGEITPVLPSTRNRRDESANSFAELGRFLPFIIAGVGAIVSVVIALADSEPGALGVAAVGIFMSIVVGAYKWYWRDSGPWR